MKDILDLHTHTLACGHAYNTLFEMFEGAHQRGLALFGSSDHAPNIPGASSYMYFSNFKVVPRTYKDMPVMLGCELDIIDHKGAVDLPTYVLRKLDYAIASIHGQCYHNGTVAENTAAVIGALQNPFVKILGHPDDNRYPVDYRPIVEAARDCHKLIELNNSSLIPGNGRPGARANDLKLLPLCAELGVSIIVNSDAHVVTDIGRHEYAMALLEEIHFPEELVVNTSLEKLASFIPAVSSICGLKTNE
ncbi:MAG: phosphatase [bacterium]|nr:phosphatase [bacterium]